MIVNGGKSFPKDVILASFVLEAITEQAREPREAPELHFTMETEPKEAVIA